MDLVQSIGPDQKWGIYVLFSPHPPPIKYKVEPYLRTSHYYSQFPLSLVLIFSLISSRLIWTLNQYKHF